jgi:hypothetical protein
VDSVESLAQILHASYSDGFEHGLHYPSSPPGRGRWEDLNEEKREQWREAATIWLDGNILASGDLVVDQYGVDPDTLRWADFVKLEPGVYRVHITKGGE